MKKKNTISDEKRNLTDFADKIEQVQKDYNMYEQHITIIKPNKLKEKEAFVKVFQIALKYFVDTLSPSGCKLFMYFICQTQYNNIIEVDQSEIQEELKMGRTALNKGIKELIDINIIRIIQDKNDKRRNVYIINHYVTWKGNPGERIRSIKTKKGYFINPSQLKLNLPSDVKTIADQTKTINLNKTFI